MFRLIVAQAGRVEGRFFSEEAVGVGRGSENQVVLSDPKASRRHCQVVRIPGGYKLVDLGSQNGTKLNGEYAVQAKLRAGDRIEIGDVSLWFDKGPPDVMAALAGSDAGAAETEAARAALEERLRTAVLDMEKAFGREGLHAAERAVDEVLAPKGASRLRSLEEKVEQLRRLQHVTAAISSTLDPARLMALIVDSAIDISGAERGFLLVADADADAEIRFPAARNFDREFVKKPGDKISRSIAEQVMKSGEVVLSEDALHDERFAAAVSVSDLQLRSVACVPIRVKDRTVGALYLDNRFRDGVFTPNDLEILLAFAAQAGIAFENSSLYEENIEKQRALERTNEKVEKLNRLLEEKLEKQEASLSLAREKPPAAAPEPRAETFKHDFSPIVGRSPKLIEIFRLLDKVVDSDVPVVIQGESGTGKELVARAIHFNSPRRAKRFVSENCAAIPETLLESELFGYKRGAFTGAEREKTGLFEMAHQGTLFLDEIGDMSLEMQKKLLRALQEGEIRPVGGNQVVRVDVRVLSASNKNLKKLTEEGLFREDLYYRLSVITVQMPPLRERREDIPALVDFFLEKATRETGLSRKRFSEQALLHLAAYSWPGNVRELENEVRRAIALSTGDVLGPEALSEEIRPERGTGVRAAAEDDPSTLKEIVRKATEEIEREVISKVLARTGWKKTEAARILGISRPTLDAKIDAFGLAKS